MGTRRVSERCQSADAARNPGIEGGAIICDGRDGVPSGPPAKKRACSVLFWYNSLVKNRDFFYLQYNKINWRNQAQTKINQHINYVIIQDILLGDNKKEFSLFDIGFGIGFFIEMLVSKLQSIDKKLVIEGCEPSTVNFEYFKSHLPTRLNEDTRLTIYNETFQKVQTATKFDYITAIYVFPHFLSEDLENIVKKIHTMLKEEGKLILVLANEEYLKNKLATEKDLSIETKNIVYNSKEYQEVLHYSDIPQIGKIIDYNREEDYYVELFTQNGFDLFDERELNDNGFVCTLFVFKAMQN